MASASQQHAQFGVFPRIEHRGAFGPPLPIGVIGCERFGVTTRRRGPTRSSSRSGPHPSLRSHHSPTGPERGTGRAASRAARRGLLASGVVRRGQHFHVTGRGDGGVVSNDATIADHLLDSSAVERGLSFCLIGVEEPRRRARRRAHMAASFHTRFFGIAHPSTCPGRGRAGQLVRRRRRRERCRPERHRSVTSPSNMYSAARSTSTSAGVYLRGPRVRGHDGLLHGDGILAVEQHELESERGHGIGTAACGRAGSHTALAGQEGPAPGRAAPRSTTQPRLFELEVVRTRTDGAPHHRTGAVATHRIARRERRTIVERRPHGVWSGLDAATPTPRRTSASVPATARRIADSNPG